MPTLIETKDLKKHFPIKQQGFFKKTLALKAVDGIDLTIEKGETLGIVGESGCGKSTLGRLLIRLLDPTEGHIRFDGKAIESLGGTALKHQRRAM
jgi:ABC-type oligopeptide transport system ATPase subunit